MHLTSQTARHLSAALYHFQLVKTDMRNGAELNCINSTIEIPNKIPDLNASLLHLSPIFAIHKKRKMKNTTPLLLIFVLALLCSTSCKKDQPEDPIIPNEEEVITTINFTLTPEDGGTPVVLSFQDLDGDGGNTPSIIGGTLTANATYNGELELLNELEDPAGNISEEVLEEAEDHQFFFQTSFSGLNIAYNDADANGNPVGLESILTTTEAGSGTLTIILRHEPNKEAAQVSSGDITNAGGETDIEVTFDIDVQ
ncbi:MAG: hypothetical protein ACI9HG_001830 [Flavobacteriales bacterium]|jgi:hypothetical protein